MNNFLKLYEAGAVKRWHTKVTIKEQDLAAHQWGVAMVLMHIYPGADSRLIGAALTHDLHESEAGDIPYPFKKANPKVAELYTQQEEDFDEEHGLRTGLSSEEEHILKWCDMFELLLWAERESVLGNLYMTKTTQVAINALNAMGPPNEAAEELFNEVTNDQ